MIKTEAIPSKPVRMHFYIHLVWRDSPKQDDLKNNNDEKRTLAPSLPPFYGQEGNSIGISESHIELQNSEYVVASVFKICFPGTGSEP